uniref:SERPIN domain-containing protein n=1 Tax=Panagrellus redivivus TaxID=6233 RepID=A0A7E4ZVZ6_PANRE
MASFLKICFTVILFSTFVLNVESKQTPYPGVDSNTVDMTCKDIHTNKPLYKLYRDEHVESLSNKTVWFMNCNFTFAAVEFQADLLLTSPSKVTLELIKISRDLYNSITQMKTKFSSNIAKIMDMISQLDGFDDNDSNVVRNNLFELLKNFSKVEPFVLLDFLDLEVILPNITMAPSVKKMESEIENACSINMTCNLASFGKMWDYVAIVEHRDLLTNNSLLLDCNFTLGVADFRTDLFLIERSNETKMDTDTFFKNVSFLYKKKTNQQFKTQLTRKSCDILTVLPLVYLPPNKDTGSKERLKNYVIRHADMKPFLLSDFPQFELKMTNITQITPVPGFKTAEDSYFPIVFDFILFQFILPLCFITIVDRYVVKHFCST